MQTPPVISSTSARPRLMWWVPVVLLVVAAGATVLYAFNPSQYGFYPRCPMYVTTGLLCPGCGSQRALYQLIHGHLLTALRCNVLFITSLPFGTVFAARWVTRWLAGEPLPQFAPGPRAVWITAAVLIVFTVLRNLHFAPFIYLAPPS